jgi:hypothetical protein
VSITRTHILAAANLAEIAYIDEGDENDQKTAMIAALDALGADANGPWTLRWGPATNDGVLALVAQGADGSYALAFRGSLLDDDAPGFFENWLADLSSLTMVPWMYPQSSQAYVSSGMNGALSLAVALTDPSSDASLVDYLRGVASASGGTLDLAVTGHSLGGALAALGSVWLADQLPKAQGVTAQIVPFTFAAPTVGDGNFAQLFDSLFSGGAYGCVNTQDVVPMAWADVQGVIDSFGPEGETLEQYSFALWIAAEGVAAAIAGDYAPLTYSDPDPFAGPAISSTNDWATEAAIQHSMEDVYLAYVESTEGAEAVP